MELRGENVKTDYSVFPVVNEMTELLWANKLKESENIETNFIKQNA